MGSALLLARHQPRALQRLLHPAEFREISSLSLSFWWKCRTLKSGYFSWYSANTRSAVAIGTRR